MNRTRTGAAALALTAATLLAPAVASADPVVDVPANTTYEIGDSVFIGGHDCLGPGGVDTWGGAYVQPPGETTYFPTIERKASAGDGAFGWTGTSDDMPTGDMSFLFYCSTEPVTPETALDDPSMLWVSAAYDVTFVSPASPNRTTSGTARGAGSNGSMTFQVNADALPRVDRVGITGPTAAKLKGKVDKAAPTVARIQRLYNVFLGRNATTTEVATLSPLLDRGLSDSTLASLLGANPEFKKAYAKTSKSGFIDLLTKRTTGKAATAKARAAGVTKLAARKATPAQVALAYANSPAYVERTANTNYVIAASIVVGKGVPTSAASKGPVQRLDAGQTKVQVIEDLALTVHSASWWIAKG